MMQRILKSNLVLSVFGLGIAIGALSTELSLTKVLLFAVGLGVMQGAVFREVAKTEKVIADTQQKH